MKYIKRSIVFVILTGLVVGAVAMSGDNEQQQYRTAAVDRGDISQVVTAIGTLNPIELISVGTQVSGQITKMHVQVSDEVKKGQLLAEIDPLIPEAQLRQSKTSLQTARITYEQAGRDLKRSKMLVEKNFIAKVELERAEQTYISAANSYELAKTQVERDEVNLSYTKITSPIDGVVIAQEVTMGQTVASNFQTPNLFKIAGDLTKMKIDVNFSEADISQVKMGQPVRFTVDAFPDEEFTGAVKLVNLNPTAGSTSGVTYSVVVEVDNKERKLLPGMTAYVSVILSEKKDVLRVPAAALRFTPPPEQVTGFKRLLSGGGGMRMRPLQREKQVANSSMNGTVYVLRDGIPTAIDVKTGGTDESYMEILTGDVKQGEQVITGIIPKTGG